MNRLQKKCLIASAVFHGSLLLLLLFGSAFFVAKEKESSPTKLRFVPTRFVESALAGGGGNPKIAQSDDVQKGQTLAPVEPPAAPPQPKPPQAKPAPTPPPATPVVEAPPSRPEPRKTEAKTPKRKPAPKPVPVAEPKPTDKTPPVKHKIDLAELKPVDHSVEERHRKEQEQLQAEAEAREAREKRRQEALGRQQLLQQIGKATAEMQRGFSDGTKVDVGGPGGEAYANYSTFVQAAYGDAWKTPQDLSDSDSVAVVTVTISRTGRVLSSRIIQRSGNSSMDRSVQRALDHVRNQGLPSFPSFIKDSERSFTIEFNLKTKRLLG